MEKKKRQRNKYSRQRQQELLNKSKGKRMLKIVIEKTFPKIKMLKLHLERTQYIPKKNHPK